MDKQQSTLDWLLGADPTIQWQTLQDIINAPTAEVTNKRMKVCTDGIGAEILANQANNGTWDDGSRLPEMHTLRVLSMLCDMGLDPTCEPAREMITKVKKVKWLMEIKEEELPEDQDIHWWHKPFFDGEVEPCVNGRLVRIGAYFGVDVQPVVDLLLQEQMEDGGWNCAQEQGSTRGSFNTTVNVLEGLLEFELQYGKTIVISNARQKGHEYLLTRHMFKSATTGKPIASDNKDNHDFTEFCYPCGSRYDILRGLDYLRKAEVNFDPRIEESLEIVRSKQVSDGTWLMDVAYEEEPVAEPKMEVGKPSYWITLRAMRVLNWFTENDTSGKLVLN